MDFGAIKSNRFSDAVIVFREKRFPEEATPVGYAALIGDYNLEVPFPSTPLYAEEQIFTRRFLVAKVLF